MSSRWTPKALLMKSRSINEAYIVTNQRKDEEETIQTENMLNSIRLKEKNLKKKIWREDLAQPQGEPLTKLAKVFTLTSSSRIRSMTTSSRIWILQFDQRTIYQPPLHPNPQRILLTGQTSASSNWFIPSLHVCNGKEEKKNPMERWPFSSPRFPVHMRVVLVTRVSTCLVMTDWTTWKGMAWTWPGRTGLHGTGLWVLD